MDPLRKVKDASGQYQYADLSPSSTSFPTSQNATGGQRMSSGTESAISKTIQASNIPWGGHVDASALVGSLSRFALTTCGMAIHVPSKTNGLVILDKDIERFLSPILAENGAAHVRGLSRDLLRSSEDRRALSESLGIKMDSPVAAALFGDSSDFPNECILDFERRLARISDREFFCDLAADLIPVPVSYAKLERRGFFSPGGAGPGPPDNPGVRIPFGTPGVEDDGAGGGSPSLDSDGSSPKVSAEADDDREFVRSVSTRLCAAYDSDRLGIRVLHRLLGAPFHADLMAHVKDFPQARIVAEEFGMPILSSSASAAQRKAFVASVKDRLAMVLHEFDAADRNLPRPPHRVWADGSRDGRSERQSIPISDDDSYALPRRGRTDGEVKDMAARLELERIVQARVTASQMRCKASIAKLRALSSEPFPEEFASVKGLPAQVLMEIDVALQRQLLLRGLLEKAVALSAATAGGLMARRAALVLKKPDAHFARMIPLLIQSGSGLSRLTLLERTYGLFPTESWAFLAALEEYTGTPNADVEELYRAASSATWKDSSGQPAVSKDYLLIFELLSRVDGEEAEFNVEKVFNAMMQGIVQVGLGSVPEWNSIWRELLTESLKWKASGHVLRPALDLAMDRLGKYSLTEATTQQIRSVYSPSGVLVAELQVDSGDPWSGQERQVQAVDMSPEEFGKFDLFQLSQEDKPSGRLCFKCSTPYLYGSDFCINCRIFKDDIWHCIICNAPTQ